MQNLLTLSEKLCRSLGLQGFANLAAAMREVGGPIKAARSLMVYVDQFTSCIF